MDIFQQVQRVVAAIPQTPREFLVESMDEDWQHAMIFCYPLGAEQCYVALLITLCPDCQEQQTRLAVFARCEQGFRLLNPKETDLPL